MQDQLAQSETETGLALIALYKALGGGWEDIVAAENQNQEQETVACRPLFYFFHLVHTVTNMLLLPHDMDYRLPHPVC